MPALRSRRVASTLAFALIAAAVALCAATAVSRAASSSAVSSSETPGTWCGGATTASRCPTVCTASSGPRTFLRGAPAHRPRPPVGRARPRAFRPSSTRKYAS